MNTGKRSVRCPGCGTFIVCDDATCTMKHPNPICGFFEATAKRFNMKPKHEPWVEMVRPDGSVVDKGKA